MHTSGHGLPSLRERAEIAASLECMLVEEGISTEVVVVVPRADPAVSWASGQITRDTISVTVRGFLSALSQREVARSEGRYQASDLSLRLLSGEEPADSGEALLHPGRTDLLFITPDGARYSVISLQRDALSLHWRLVGRRVP